MAAYIPAGRYVELQRRARTTLEELEALARGLGWASIGERLKATSQILEETAYTVVVTGRSRAGKSTLMNALIGRTIFPSEKTTTTAVPILVAPGAHEHARVYYRNGDKRELDGPLHAQSLAPYAAQSNNPDNERRISAVNVWLQADILETGTRFVDIPGFDDASEEIAELTEQALKESDALIVVLDVSPFRDGGFSLDKKTVTLLKDSHKPAFLLCNKIARLERDDRRAVVAHINDVIRKKSIQLAAPPFEISALAATGAIEDDEESPREFESFKSSLWEFLWNSKETGLQRLQSVFGELDAASRDCESLIAARTAAIPERNNLKAKIASCNEAIRTARQEMRAAYTSAVSHLQSETQKQKDKSVQLAQQRSANLTELPKISTYSKSIAEDMAESWKIVADDTSAYLQKRQSLAIQRLNKNLVEIRFSPTNPLDLKNATRKGTESNHGLGDLLAMGGASSLIGSLGVPAIAALVVGGFVGGGLRWFFRELRDNPKSIDDLVSRTSRQLQAHADAIASNLDGELAKATTRTVDSILNGLTAHLSDLADRLEDVRELTDHEKQTFGRMQEHIATARKLLDDIFVTPSA